MIVRLGKVVQIKLSDIDSNIYLIGDTIIDSGTGFNFTRLKDIFRVLKKEMKDVKRIVNTHGHFDHIGGNGYFLNAKVAIHKSDAGIIENADGELAAADFFNGRMHPHEVDRKLENGDKILADGMELEVIHTPAHTHGSICLFARKEGILFSGDLVFKDGIGRTDFANSDPALMSASLEKVKALPVKQVLPGHGEVFDKKALDKIVDVCEDYL
jgi:glyoxylase-like metal-dependent hydrolase (beta-lactamase superfamily II)